MFDDDKFCLHPDDSANFLKLSATLQLLIKHEISDDDLTKADQLIRKYDTELIQVLYIMTFGHFYSLTISQLYCSNVIKPNHHYATHVADCSHNFGPLHDFWTFLYE